MIDEFRNDKMEEHVWVKENGGLMQPKGSPKRE